nr:MAG TPA: hypothetical protein [Caudoviricetes sp.]
MIRLKLVRTLSKVGNTVTFIEHRYGSLRLKW